MINHRQPRKYPLLAVDVWARHPCAKGKGTQRRRGHPSVGTAALCGGVFTLGLWVMASAASAQNTPLLATQSGTSPHMAAASAYMATPTFSMDQAVMAALETHPAIRGAQERVKQAESEIKAAKSGYKPQIQGGLQNQISARPSSSYDSRYTYNATLTGEQMLLDFGKVAGMVDRARAQETMGQAQLALSADDVALSTAQAWLDVYLQQSLVQLAQDQLAAMTAIADLVADRVAKGATSRSDIAQARSRVNAVRAQLLGAESEAMRARLTLMHLTGQSVPVDIIGGIPAHLTGASCLVDDVAGNHYIQMAEANRQGARADYAVASAQRMPTISLSGDMGYALTKGSRLNGEYRTTGHVGLKVSMPLYQGGGTQARAESARHSLRSAEEGVQQAELEQRQRLSATRAQYEGWRQREPILADRVDNIDTTRTLYRQQYLYLGTRTLIDLLNAEQEYHGARVELTQALQIQYRLATECLYFQGGLRDKFIPEAPTTAYGPPVDR